MVFYKGWGSLRLHLLVGPWVERRRRSERLQSEPESASEFVALAEETREYSSVLRSDASGAIFGAPTSTSGEFAARW